MATNHLSPKGRSIVDCHANYYDELPENVFSALRRSPAEFARDMRLAAAIHGYSRGEISQERAAQVAGMDRTDFLKALAAKRVDTFVVDFEDLRRELDRG